MGETKYLSGLRALGLLLAVALAAAVLAACGGSDSSSGDATSSGGSTSEEATGGGSADSGLAEAEKMLAGFEAPLQFNFKGKPFDASSARGKTVWFIGISLAIPAQQAWLHGTEEALGELGITVKPFDGKGDVGEINRGIQQAVGSGADAILLAAGDLDNVANSVKVAEEAGIPIINGAGGELGTPTGHPGVVAGVTYDWREIGSSLGAWTVAGGGDVDSLVIEASDAEASAPYVEGYESTVEELAPESKVEVDDAPVAQWETRLPTLTQSAVGRDPNLNYMVPLYDAMLLQILPALNQAGATDKVNIGTANATPAMLEEQQKGGPIGANVLTPQVWFGWATADQILRVLTGTEPVENEEIPIRILDESNIGEIDPSANETTWYGPVDFKGKYKAIWGLGG